MSSNKRYWHEVVGTNARMTNIQAALGLAQLENLENNILTFGKVLTGNPEKNVSTEFKVNGILETSYVEHAYIEPEAGSAWMEKNVLVIQACTQAPYMDRDDTAKILDMELDNIRIKDLLLPSYVTKSHKELIVLS